MQQTPRRVDVPQLGYLVMHVEPATGATAAHDPSARADASTSPVDGGGWEAREMLALEGIAA